MTVHYIYVKPIRPYREHLIRTRQAGTVVTLTGIRQPPINHKNNTYERVYCDLATI